MLRPVFATIGVIEVPTYEKGYPMAYRPRRSTARRSSPARRSYGTRRRSTGGTRRSTATRSRVSRQQTLKIVIEQTPTSPVSRPEGPLQVAAAPSKKSKF